MKINLNIQLNVQKIVFMDKIGNLIVLLFWCKKSVKLIFI